MSGAPSAGGALLPYQDQKLQGDLAVTGSVTVTGNVTATGTITGAGSGGSFASPAITGTVTGGASYTAPTLTSPTITGTTAIGAGATLTSPTLVTPALGTPASGVLSSCTAYPIASLTGGGTGVLTALAANTGASGGFAVNGVAGVANGYKTARGVHTQVAASDTVVTGLATVVAVTVQFQSAPTVKQLYCATSIGNQSGAPAAGSILINTYKPTAVNDCTPTAATDFSENLVLNWIAVGT